MGRRQNPWRGRHLLPALVAAAGLMACQQAPLDEDAAIERARVALAGEQFRTAMIELKNVLQVNPGNASARAELARLDLYTGQHAAAEAGMRKAVEYGYERRSLLIPLGQALLLQEKNDQLLSEIEPDAGLTPAEQAELLALRGSAYLSLGNHEDAVHEFRRALELEPEHVGALSLLAKSSLNDGDYAAAAALVEQALAAAPEDANVWSVKGSLELEQGRIEAAEASFKRAMSLFKHNYASPNLVKSASSLVELLVARGAVDEAMPYSDRLLALAPDSPTARYVQAYVHYKAGNHDTAAMHLAKVLHAAPKHFASIALSGAVHYALGDYERAHELLSKALAVEPGDARLRELLAATKLALGRPDQAEDVAVAKAEGTTAEGRAMTANLAAMLGTATLRGGDTDRGIAYLEQALEDDPDNDAFKQELIIAYLVAGERRKAYDLIDAIAPSYWDGRQLRLLVRRALIDGEHARAQLLVRQLLEKEPASAEAHALAARVMAAGGLQAEAIAALDAASELHPQQVEALLEKGRLLFRDGQREAARAAFEEAARRDPGNRLVLYSLLRLQELAQDRDGQLRWMEKIRAADPADVEIRLTLARHHLDRGDRRAAFAAIQEALNADPGHLRTLTLAGDFARGEKNWRQAAMFYGKAAELAGDQARLHYHLGLSLIELRQLDRAMGALGRAYELDPDNSDAGLKLASLKALAGEHQAALEIANRLQRAHPAATSVLILKGNVLASLQQYPQAMESYRGALRREPTAKTLLMLHRVHKLAGSPETRKVLTDWLERRPDDLEVKYVYIGELAAGGDSGAAKRELRQVLKVNPSDATALRMMAGFYPVDSPDAALYARNAYDLDRDNPRAADTYGWILFNSGERDKGMPMIERAARLLQRDPEVQYHYARVLAQRGDTEGARRLLDRILSARVEFESRAQAQELRGSLM